MNLAERVLRGDEKCAARLITLIENGDRKGHEELIQLLPHTGRAHVIGITGPAGVGKSTLIAKLIGRYCDERRTVGVIAIDPTSIQSQGAILGDRARMKDVELAGGVFVRSMADRGQGGGISRAALGAVHVLEALGKEIVIIESVGAGQSDKGLYYLCDTVVTLFTPEFGDELQLLKAGLLEIGDVVVVNKTDKPGSADAVSVISALAHGKTADDWLVPVISTRADTGVGVEELAFKLDARWRFLQEGRETRSSRRSKPLSFLTTLLKEEAWKRVESFLSDDEAYKETIRQVRAKVIDTYTAVERIGDLIERRLASGR